MCDLLNKNEDIVFETYPFDEEFLVVTLCYLHRWIRDSSLELKEKAIETLAVMACRSGKMMENLLSIQDISLFDNGLNM